MRQRNISGRGMEEDEPRVASDVFFFDGLPDEVVALIFNKFLDAKWLCIISLVSKRFEAIIFTHIHRVVFYFSHPMPKTRDSLLESEFDSFAASINLFRFPNIRHLHLDLPNQNSSHVQIFSNHLHEDDLIKWGVKLGTNFDGFAFLSVTDPSRDEVVRLMTYSCLNEAAMRFLLMASLAKAHHMLESISLTDKKNKWGAKMFVSGENLVLMRDTPFRTLYGQFIFCEPVWAQWTSFILEELTLPSSGDVIRKQSKLEFLHVPNRWGDTVPDVMACFDREDKFVRELVAAIFAKQSKTS